MINQKNMTVAIVESMTILLFNLVVLPPFFDLVGAVVTVKQQFIISFSMAMLRIVWFYFVLSQADAMMKIVHYFVDWKGRK